MWCYSPGAVWVEYLLISKRVIFQNSKSHELTEIPKKREKEEYLLGFEWQSEEWSLVDDGARAIPGGPEDLRQELEEGGGVCGNEDQHLSAVARPEVLREHREEQHDHGAISWAHLAGDAEWAEKDRLEEPVQRGGGNGGTGNAKTAHDAHVQEQQGRKRRRGHLGARQPWRRAELQKEKDRKR